MGELSHRKYPTTAEGMDANNCCHSMARPIVLLSWIADSKALCHRWSEGLWCLCWIYECFHKSFRIMTNSWKVTQNSLSKCRHIRIRCSRRSIVYEWQTIWWVASGPVGKIRVEKTLITAIEASNSVSELHQFSKSFHARLEHEHAWVETVGPANVWRCWEFVVLEELIAVLKDLKKWKT